MLQKLLFVPENKDNADLKNTQIQHNYNLLFVQYNFLHFILASVFEFLVL